MDESTVRVPLRVDGLTVKRELVLASSSSNGTFIVHSIPAFAYGVGVGDRLKLLDEQTGTFRVIVRAGNVTIRVFLSGALDHPMLDALIEEVCRLGGQFEIAKNSEHSDGSSMLLLSVPVTVGFPLIETMMAKIGTLPAKWEYGNIYDANGTSLNWW